MSRVWSGGCACGALRYDIAGDPLVMTDCQCLDCQGESGTGHASHLVFPSKDVTIPEAATGWEMLADSGKLKTRHFCRTCGSPVFMTFAATPDILTVRAASLDEPDRYRPQMVTYTSRGHAWDHLDPAIPKFRKMPG
jgi:hypothetical protein